MLATKALPVAAAEYSMTPQVILSGSYDDNARLNVDNEIELSGYAVETKFETRRTSEQLDIALDTDFKFNRFNDQDFDTDDQDIALAIDYDYSDKSRFSFSSRLDRDSVSTSEQDLDSEPNIAADRRELTSAGLGWNYRLSDSSSIDLTYNWQKLRYASEELTDYQNQSAIGTLVIGYSAITQFQLSVEASRIEFDANDFATVQEDPRIGGPVLFNGLSLSREQETLGLQLGFIRVLSEQWRLDVLAGYSKVDNKAETLALTFPQRISIVSLFPPLVDVTPELTQETEVIEASSSNTLLLNSTLSYTGERSNASINVFSRNQPSSDGQLNENYGASIRYGYEWSDRVNVNGIIRLSETKRTGNTIDDKRARAVLSLRVGYRLAERWRVGLRYRYRFQDRDVIDEDVQSHGWFLTLSYSPKKVMW